VDAQAPLIAAPLAAGDSPTSAQPAAGPARPWGGRRRRPQRPAHLEDSHPLRFAL